MKICHCITCDSFVLTGASVVLETIWADFSQDNTRQFGKNAGKQCVVMSLTVIIHTQVKTYYNMGFIILKYTILSLRNIRYTCIYNSIKIFFFHIN